MHFRSVTQQTWKLVNLPQFHKGFFCCAAKTFRPRFSLKQNDFSDVEPYLAPNIGFGMVRIPSGTQYSKFSLHGKIHHSVYSISKFPFVRQKMHHFFVLNISVLATKTLEVPNNAIEIGSISRGAFADERNPILVCR